MSSYALRNRVNSTRRSSLLPPLSGESTPSGAVPTLRDGEDFGLNTFSRILTEYASLRDLNGLLPEGQFRPGVGATHAEPKLRLQGSVDSIYILDLDP